MKRFVFLILAMTSICPALAGSQTTPTLVVPKTSTLSPSVVAPDASRGALFSGQVWVNGLFIVQWPDGTRELHPSDKMEVSIKLDEEERKRLPYYDWPEWKQTYIPHLVVITNPEEAVNLVFPKDLSASVLSKKVRVAKVHAKFLLGNYEIGIECDASWARAKLISANVSETAQISDKLHLTGC